MRRAVWLVPALLFLTACGGGHQGDASRRSSVESATAPDGTQSYSTLEELRAAMLDNAGVACGELIEEPNPAAADAQATCDFGGKQLVLQLWADGDARDDGTTDLILILPSSLGYCFVMGSGDDAGWSINASDDPAACERLTDGLGGRKFEESADAVAPTPTTPPVVAIAAPVVYTGTGDTVLPITKPTGADLVIATIAGNDAGRLFAVKGLDGDQDLLVNTTDPYNGSVLMDADRGGTTQLQVSAVGDWSITLSDFRSAPTLNGAASGTGDAVYLYPGGSGVAAITGNAAGRLFAVLQYTGTGRNLLVNTTDPYTGSVPFDAGPSLVEISAVDDWTITIS